MGHAVCGRDKFGTLRKKDSDHLTQVWVLNPRYRVGALKQRKFSILEEGRNNSVLALARGHYVERELVRPAPHLAHPPSHACKPEL